MSRKNFVTDIVQGAAMVVFSLGLAVGCGGRNTGLPASDGGPSPDADGGRGGAAGVNASAGGSAGSSDGDAGNSGGNTSDGGGSKGTGGRASKCPADAPAAGTSCSEMGLVCGYGDSARADCRRVFSCNGAWTRTNEDCASPPSGFCPSDTPQGKPCDSIDYSGNPQLVAGGACEYVGNTLCVCYSCARRACPTGQSTWDCGAPMPAAGCPPSLPNLGADCSIQALDCVYGDPCTPSGMAVFCHNGAWERSASVSCPE